MLWSCWIIFQETKELYIFLLLCIFFPSIKLTLYIQSWKHTWECYLSRQTKKKETNEWMWCCLLSDDCCDSQAAARSSADPSPPMVSPPNALRSSSFFPLRGYEIKYDGTHNIKKKKGEKNYIWFLSCFLWEGNYIWFWYYTLFSVMMTNSDGNTVW